MMVNDIAEYVSQTKLMKNLFQSATVEELYNMFTGHVIESGCWRAIGTSVSFVDISITKDEATTSHLKVLDFENQYDFQFYIFYLNALYYVYFITT